MSNLQDFYLVVPKRRRQGEVLPVVLRYHRSVLRKSYYSRGRHIPGDEGWNYVVGDGVVTVHAIDTGSESLGAQVQKSLKNPWPGDRVSDSFQVAFPLLLRTDELAPGEHIVTASLRIEMYRSWESQPPTKDAPWVRSVHIRGMILIDSKDAAPSVAKRTDSRIADLLRSQIRFFRHDGTRGNVPWSLIIDFPLPVAIAGSFHLRGPNGEHPLGSVVLPEYRLTAGGNPVPLSGLPVSAQAAAFADAAPEVTLVFRSREDRAVEHPEIEEVWGTDLEIARFVWPDGPPAQPTTAATTSTSNAAEGVPKE